MKWVLAGTLGLVLAGEAAADAPPPPLSKWARVTRRFETRADLSDVVVVVFREGVRWDRPELPRDIRVAEEVTITPERPFEIRLPGPVGAPDDIQLGSRQMMTLVIVPRGAASRYSDLTELVSDARGGLIPGATSEWFDYREPIATYQPADTTITYQIQQDASGKWEVVRTGPNLLRDTYVTVGVVAALLALCVLLAGLWLARRAWCAVRASHKPA
ncbi:unnamed protein product [Gemmataceae bacterium]|nr:unnamed protein product [Gemmataceae bacterium]VTT99676.1 unnamed protein product [Gemmataceae bacterium]